MCQGFGMIVDKTGKAYFTAPDQSGNVSHSEILEALGWKDNQDTHLRHFVRVECADWTMKSFRFDEEQTLPGWVDKDEIKKTVGKAITKAAPAWAEYEKVCAPAWAEYDKVRVSAWAEYEKVCAPAWAEYDKVRASARATMQKALRTIPGYVEC